MFRRYPLLSTLVVWMLAASIVAIGRLMYLDLGGRVANAAIGGQSSSYAPAWTSARAWLDGSFHGVLIGGIVASFCFMVLTWNEDVTELWRRARRDEESPNGGGLDDS